jgi:hypothetical protein
MATDKKEYEEKMEEMRKGKEYETEDLLFNLYFIRIKR